MLVHICCSVDSHYFLQELKSKFPEEKLIGFFYNPNIHPKEEYDLRLLDVKRSCNKLGIPLLIGDYDFNLWTDSIIGLENEEEKGERCSVCFDVRLLKAAALALEIGENKISTTLLTSPMKSQNELFSLGKKIAEKYNLEFIMLDTRSNGGTQKQSKLAKDSNLYRQNYCGCQYALKKQRDRKNDVSIELFSEIGQRVLKGSAKYHTNIFLEVWELEKANKPFVLHKNQINAYRLLSGIVKQNNIIIPSYIFANSKAVKNLKIRDIKWHRIPFDDMKIPLGISDNAILLTIESINLIFKSSYKRVLDMLYNRLAYDDELDFRIKLLGKDSIKPIIVLENELVEQLIITIDSIFQKIDIFELIKV